MHLCPYMEANAARFRRILLPVDFCEQQILAVPHVKAMAQQFGATITLLHVVKFPIPWDGDLPSLPDSYCVDREVRASRSLAATARLQFDGCRIEISVRHGDPAAQILAYARERGIDLIMMPSTSRTRLGPALLGSVTADVLSESDCAVWTCMFPHCQSTADTPALKSVLCAVDLGPESRQLIEIAASIGNATGAKVRLVHAVPGEDNMMQRSMNFELQAFLEDCARRAAAKLQRDAGTAFDLCLKVGTPAHVIDVVARHHDADLVLIGRGKLRHWAGPLRTGAWSIVRDSPCPVLSFP